MVLGGVTTREYRELFWGGTVIRWYLTSCAWMRLQTQLPASPDTARKESWLTFSCCFPKLAISGWMSLLSTSSWRGLLYSSGGYRLEKGRDNHPCCASLPHLYVFATSGIYRYLTAKWGTLRWSNGLLQLVNKEVRPPNQPKEPVFFFVVVFFSLRAHARLLSLPSFNA